ncbi:MAG: hypothetical protein GX081_06390 [Firmicutes bacterium]|nr:hypothetical protein [Bacillota bacterium]
MSKSKIIKAPNIKNEVCFLEVPEPIVASQELAVAMGENVAAMEETGAAVDEEMGTGLEQEPLPSDPEAAAAQLLAQTQLEAEEIISAARREADLLLAEAEAQRRQVEEELARTKAETAAECEQLKKEAYDTGYQEGWATGQQEGEKAWAEKISAAEATLEEAKKEALNLINQAEKERAARIQDSEEEILKLAVDIAEKIINTELRVEPEKWLGMIRKAAHKIAGATEVTIRIAPEDEAFLIQNLRAIRSEFTEAPLIQIKTDVNLKSGDFMIQSNLGNVDAKISQQLTKIFQALKVEGS